MNKKVLFVVAQEGFQEWEYGTPRKILESAGAEVEVASLDSGAAVGSQGLIVRVEYRAKDIRVEDFDAVVFVGGGGMVPLVNEYDLKKLARDFFEAGKIVAAICIAPMLLANEGILNGKNAAIHESAKKEFAEKGVNCVGADVEIDGKIITANGPMAAEKFGKTILQNLK